MRRVSRWVMVAAMLLFFWLALSSMVHDSPTMDEQNHLARGLALLATGDPRLSLEHPPLVNSLSALPVQALLDVRLPLDDPSWEQPQGWYRFAELLLWEYNSDPGRIIFLARLPIVWLTLGLALAGYHFARAFGGRAREGAGLLTFALLLFDPNIMAHGRYTTTDLGGTLFLFIAAFLLWRLWRSQGWAWGRLLAAALGLGLAFGSKLSTLAFAPIFALLALLPIYGGGRFAKSPYRDAGRRLLQLVLAGAGALLVVWAIFAFQWGPFIFASPGGAGAGSAVTRFLARLNQLSGPMPTFWAGIEQILLLSGGGRPSFLLGRTSTDGFLAYFPVAFISKTPLLNLLLLLTALALWLRRLLSKSAPARTPSAGHSPLAPCHSLYLLLPPLLYFLLSLSSDLNIGYRHLLPMLPFLYTFAGVEVAAALQALQKQPEFSVYEEAGSSDPASTGREGKPFELRPHEEAGSSDPASTRRDLRIPFSSRGVAFLKRAFRSRQRHGASGKAQAVALARQHDSPTTSPTPYSLLPTSLLLLLLLVVPLRIHPHYLSYFNLLVGGPENGYKVLVDSNVDWGQDLLRLKGWMAANQVAQVRLAWFGSAPPAHYGVDYVPLPGLPHHFDLWWLPPAEWPVPFNPAAPAPAVYAISVSNLWELPLTDDKHVFPWFRTHAPDGRVGYSILIYDLR